MMIANRKTEYSFAKTPSVDIPRSVFDRSHEHKTTFNENDLVPFYLDEALPGDTFKMNATMFCRLATPIVPFMDNLYLETFYFAVPYRLLWENWEKFCGASDLKGYQTASYLIPILAQNVNFAWGPDSLASHFGIPVGTFANTLTNTKISALPFRAYYLIYNEWFRKEALIDKVAHNIGNGPDTTVYTMQKRSKRPDYFTSCQPWPQKGAAVNLPLGGTAPVLGNGYALGLSDGSENFGLIAGTGTAYLSKNAFNVAKGASAGPSAPAADQKAIGVTQAGGQGTGLIADLSAATAATINSLRQAFQLQRFYEKQARAGSRYVEVIKSMFNVTSPDARLQRPEFLGSGSQRISINPVVQTSVTPPGGTGNATPQGNLAAFGVGTAKSGFTKSFTEHCLIIGLVNVRADCSYQAGLPRLFSRQTLADHYWPPFAHLGEQEVLNREIYWQNDGATNDELVFGYQERYAEYRYKPSEITGYYRSAASPSLDIWHLAQDFQSLPVLNQSFIEEAVPVDRVVALSLQSTPHFYFDAWIQLHCARPMPTYSVPGLIDHF